MRANVCKGCARLCVKMAFVMARAVYFLSFPLVAGYIISNWCQNGVSILGAAARVFYTEE